MQYAIQTGAAIDWAATGDQLILQNVLNLISTYTYEIPYMRDCGIRDDIVDGSLQQLKSVIFTSIIDLVNEKEPRAKLISLDLSGVDPESGDMNFKVVVEI